MGDAHASVGVQNSNSAWRVSEDFFEMATFELGFEGHIGVCHVQNRMFQAQRGKSTEAFRETNNRIWWEAGGAVDRWAGTGSGGAGIAELRDPDFLLVMGNHGGGREISSVCDQRRLPERGRLG